MSESHPGIPSRHMNARIAGWEGRDGEWRNVEAGDNMPSPRSLSMAPRVTIAIDYSGDETAYYTVSYITEDFDIDDIVDDLEGEYGRPD